MKLYPPYIEGTLPAFYTEKSGIIKLTIPFSMNRTVSPNEIGGFIIKIKTAQNNIFILTLKQINPAWYTIGSNSEVTFIIDPNSVQATQGDFNKLTIGQYYKIQIAYLDLQGTVGYYSSVGIAKYTTQPTVFIQSLSQYVSNNHIYSYTGVYRQFKTDNMGINQADVTEKEYSYQFILTDKYGKIINDTGIQIHNSDTNVEVYESMDQYKYDSDLILDQSYYIQYIVYTNNKMTIKSPKYKILQKKSIAPNINAYLEAKMNFDDGYVDVHLIGNKNEANQEIAETGSFIISRACSTDNFTTWNEIFRFSLHADQPSHQLFKDFTVEQGKEYVYGLQQYNDYGLYSSRLLSNVVTADFEDIFLYDGQRQLKVRFNPKVSSFKTTILETKVDTIGSKYPFIFRNGKVSYKEFPISGLITYLADDARLFMTDEELGLDDTLSQTSRSRTVNQSIFNYGEQEFYDLTKQGETAFVKRIKELQSKRIEDNQTFENAKVRTTQPVAYNFAAERAFKLAVLDWLNNGGIKLFRSPGEGNYLVRLMNVSLTPEDRLGRMIHTFSCTAYEVADFTYNNLLTHNVIDVDKKVYYKTLQNESIQLTVSENPKDRRYIQNGSNWNARGEMLTKNSPAIALIISGVQPGSKFTVEFKNGGIQEIIVGATGNYSLDIGEEIISIKVPNDALYQGVLEYFYYVDTTNTFNEVTNFYIHDVLGKQFVGINNNILNKISDEKFIFSKFHYLHFQKRDVHYIEQPLSSYDNPLLLYCVESNTIRVRSITTDYMYEITGITPVLSQHVQQHLISNNNNEYEDQWVVPECYYYFKTNFSNRQLVQSIGANQKPFDPEIQYYEILPFKTYYDAQGDVMITQEDHNRILEFLEITTKRTHKIQGFSILQTEIEIDGATIDLEDIGRFDIDNDIVFTSIKLSNGTMLECGYESQEVYYSAEDILKEREEFELYFLYKYYLSLDYFLEIDSGGENSITESTYNTNVSHARAMYEQLYSEYLRQLVFEISK